MKKRILLAEDESIIAMDMKLILEREGYEITSLAATAIDVIEMADRNKPDLILMDIMLEGTLDGVEAAKIISYKHNVPIIFVTATKDENEIMRSNLNVPTAVIVKPFEPEKLLGTINSLLEDQLIKE